MNNSLYYNIYQLSRTLTSAFLFLLIIFPNFSIANSMAEVTTMVELRAGLTKYQVEGRINASEWKRIQGTNTYKQEVETCWEAKLWTFIVSYQHTNPPRTCSKKGVSIHNNIDADRKSKVILDATCSDNREDRRVNVRICQPTKPGILMFNFSPPEDEAPLPDPTQEIQAKHFTIDSQKAVAFKSVLHEMEGGKSLVAFYLNNTNEPSLRDNKNGNDIPTTSQSTAKTQKTIKFNNLSEERTSNTKEESLRKTATEDSFSEDCGVEWTNTSVYQHLYTPETIETDDDIPF